MNDEERLRKGYEKELIEIKFELDQVKTCLGDKDTITTAKSGGYSGNKVMNDEHIKLLDLSGTGIYFNYFPSKKQEDNNMDKSGDTSSYYHEQNLINDPNSMLTN
jgi:hypothetical protein